MATKGSDERVRERVRKSLSSPRSQISLTIGPATAWLLLFVLLPMLFLVAVSFTTTDQYFNIIWEPTLANYEDLLFRNGLAFWEAPFVKSLYLSYAIAGATTVTTLVVSFPVAYLLARRSGPFVKVTLFMLLVPFFSVFIVRMYAWLKIFGNNGAANNVLLNLGIVSGPLGIFDYGLIPTIVALTHAFVPYMLLTLYASLDGVDFSLVEAARDLGAGRITAFKDVVVPLISSGVITGSIFVFVPALGAYLAPQFLARGQFLMIGQMIVERVYTGYSIGYGSTMAMFIAIAVVITIAILYRISGLNEFVQQ
ncbi:ABC transporter permease [Halostella sp. PRR32]|uniref:ABC transporter permease n=1 Tax=Halostella sp. PRR32 TaxID=3098147 RepID=UPI002B1D8D6B|nr:ABC transporter permease [Halostella sp. PRR32]